MIKHSVDKQTNIKLLHQFPRSVSHCGSSPESNCLRKLNYVFFSNEKGMMWWLANADMRFTVCHILSVLLGLTELDQELVDWVVGFHLLLLKSDCNLLDLTKQYS